MLMMRLLPVLKNILKVPKIGKTLAVVLVFLASGLFAQQPALTNQILLAGNKLTKVSPDVSNPAIDAMLKKYDKQIYFTENKGQWPSNVFYKADFTYGQAVATPNGMLVSSFDPAAVGARSKWVVDQEEAQHDGRVFTTPMPNLKGHAWMMNFVGSSPAMTMSNKDGHNDFANYFIGEASATNVQSFNEVWYNNVYKSIDVRYYPSAQGALEYDIIAKPGSNPASIAIKFDGIDKMEVNADGHLVLSTSVGSMDLPEPYAYQTINGREVKVDAKYALNDKGELTFILGKYNTDEPLIIDPIAMRWATWITNNSAADNHGHCIWVDPAGNIYVVSRFTGSGLITTPGAFDTTPNGGLDLNIGKYTEPSTVGGAGVRVWQTYLGGSSDENPYVCEMGPDGNLYIAGYTTSTDFPLSGGTGFSGSGLDGRTQSGDNCFVVKINPAGNGIKAAVVGGNGTDDIFDLRITSAGDIVIGGFTTSTNLSTRYSGSGASNTNNGGDDFWMYRINQDLTSVGWMRNYGGSGNDQINIINIKSSNNDIYAGGSTSSSGLSLISPRQSTKAGGTVGYLQRMNSAGTIQWSSYFNSSGSNNTSILCMEMNANQTAFYFGGMTQGLAASNISSSGVYDNSQNGSRDFYIAKMALDQTFAYSTYVGSTADEDNMMGLNVDANDDVYIFGYTYATGTLFPTAGNPLQSSMAGGSRDKVFFKLKTDLSVLNYSTYYGGSADDSDPVGQRGIKFSNCRIYTIVTAESNNIPLTQGALTTGKTSSTSIYEPALIVWANPPDLGNNTISSSQFVCNNATPTGLTGSTPNYELPNIVRNNGTPTAHPSVGTASSYQWQVSTDQNTWTDISGATGINLTAAQMGPSTVTRYFRRIINGDACVLNNGNSFVTIAVFRITGTQVNNTCFGGTTGSITITPSGNASGTINYVWSDGGANSATRTGLAAGTYTVTATASNGCTASATFTITAPTQIAFTVTPTNATCGASNGSIAVTGVSGGSGSGYTYQLNGNAFQGGNTFSGLAGGTYNITVKDGNGCTHTIQVTVGSVNTLTASISNQTNVLCFGAVTGAVTIGVTGGTPSYQYQLGSGAFGSSNVFSGLAAGAYVITVKDANNCTTTVNVNITGPTSAITAGIGSQTNVLCFGNATGSVTINASGGTGSLQYQLGSGAFGSSNVFSGLAAGAYVVTVKDANNCTTTVNVNITQPSAPLAASIEDQTNVLCYGNATGSVTIGVTGGTTAYQYQLGSGVFGSSNVFSGLAAGAYVVTVKDANGCTTTVNVNITQPSAPLAASIEDQTNVLCFGNATGSVTIGVTGGTTAYQYQLGSGAFGSSNVFSGLAAGAYVITVKDANNCTTTVNVNITGPTSAITAGIGSQTNVLCFGNATGSVTINASGGTGSLQYQLGSGAFGSSNVFSGLAAGAYVVTVKDANNCTTTVNVNITGPTSAITAGIGSQTNVLCFGNATGSVTINASGGTGALQYQLGSGAFGSSNVFSGLAAGAYVVTVKDANGCTTTVNVNITQPSAPLAASIEDQTNVLCFGNATGSVTIGVTGGTTAYQYQLGSGAFGSSNVFSGLAAGAYVVTVKDANNCTTTVNVNITGPTSAITAGIGSQTNVLCFGNATGSVTINASGGTGALQYQLGSGAFGSSNVFSGLAAGAYVVTVKDANGCTTTVNVNITQPSAPLAASIEDQTNVLCFGNATGSVTIGVTGGTIAYQYQLGSGAFGSSNVFSGLAAGAYVVTVKDANGCTTTVNVNITQPSALLAASIEDQTNVLCFGNATGSVTIGVTGGTTAYQYQLGSGAFGSSNVFSGLAAGAFVITVKDANGCTTTVNVNITQPSAPLAASIEDQTNVLCFGNATGSVTIGVTGGTTAYQYQLGSGVFGSSNVFSGLAAGAYVVTVKDANGCTTTVNVNITQPSAPLAASIEDQTNVLCFGNATGSVTIGVTGGTTAYQYQLGSGAFGSSNVFSGLAAGAYVVTVKDANNCTTTVNVNITQPSAPLAASIEDQTNVLCYGNATGSVTIGVTGGTTAYQYQLGSGVFGSSNVFSGLAAGAYVVTVKDANGCTTTVNVNITQPSAPLSVSITGSDNVCPTFATGTATAAAAGGTPGYNYVWNTIPQQTGATATGLAIGTYTVTVTDTNGCQASTSVTISNNPKPNAGSDYIICEKVAQLPVAGANEFWTGVQTNPSNAIVNNNGEVSGMTVGGVYMFILTNQYGCSDTALVTTTANCPLIANPDNASTNEDTPVTINLPGNDVDPDGNIDNGSVTIVDQPNNGSVVINPNGSIIYTPNDNFNGIDTLIYQICDTGLPVLCDTALVIINVTPVNDAPIANIDHATTPEDVNVDINVPSNDTDVDGNLDPTTVTIVDQPNNGTVTIDPVTGVITYDPNQDFNGVDTLIYQICDTGLPVLCDTALVIINVTPVNDAPIANIDHATTPEDVNVDINVPSNDTDVDGNLDPTTVTIVDQPNNGTVTVDPVTGVITYDPNQDFNGVDTLIYQICDTGLPVLCDTALVIINVTPVNDPPVAITDTASTLEDTPININIDINDYDVDGNLDTNTVVIVTPPVNGSATYDPNLGEIIYIPGPDFFGVDSLLYSICDSAGLCDTAWVYIVIESTPDITLDPSIFPSGNNISCFGANDGSINLTIDLGMPPYIISWTGPNGFTSSDEDISGLAPGTYTVIVSDLNGHSIQASVTLTEPTQLTGSGIVNSFNGGYNVSCGGQTPSCDGSIDYTISGGSPAYTISWTGPNGFTASTADISGLCVGTYTIVVTDVNGCSVTNTYTLTAPPVLEPTVVYANYNGYNVTCNGACNGSINLTVNGGVAPFTFAWSGPNNFASSDEDINNLCAGDYSVLVTDANNCTATVNVTLTQPPVLAASLVAGVYNGGVNISCANACDGSINATISGGVAPFTYSWVGVNGFASTDQNLTGLCAGTYTLTVTDANGCEATQTIMLTAPQPLAANLAAALYNGGFNISCVNACDGSINATISGGTAPYTYSWIGPNSFISIDEDITALCAGTYTLTVTDANGCTTTQTITLTAPPVLEVVGVAFEFEGGYNVSCANACNGSINLTVNGGVAPFTFVWTGPNNFASSDEDINNLCAGDYSVLVTDANNCTATVNVTLTQPPVLVASLVAGVYNGGVNISCANACDGSINATISGGVAPFTYSWVGVNGFASTDQNLTGLCAGTYTLTVTDANGCEATQTIMLTAPQPLAANLAAALYNGGFNISCVNACDGSINATISGGTAPYTYSWIGPNSFVSIDEDITALCAGTYTLTVTDANGCTTTQTITLTAPPVLEVVGVAFEFEGGYNVSCANACNGSINLTVNGGVAPFTFVWTGPNNFASSDEDINNLCAGDYSVLVTDANNCTATVNVTLTQPPVLVASLVAGVYNGGVNISCANACDGSINATISGGVAPFTYSWVGVNGFASTDQNLTGLCAGTYTLTVTDANGCEATQTIMLTAPQPLAANLAAALYIGGFNISCFNACDGSINATISGGTAPYTYSWIGPNSFVSIDEDITALCAGTYTLTVTDANGCETTQTITLTAPQPLAANLAAALYNGGFNISCVNACDGSINATISGGTAPYTYSWIGPNSFVSIDEDITALCAGTYTLTVTDANGCTTTQTITLIAPPAFEVGSTAFEFEGGYNVSCANACDGSINLIINSGVSPFNISWTGPNGFTATSEDLSGLCAGVYTATVVDANGCTSTRVVSINAPEPVSASAIAAVVNGGYNITCFGACNGSINGTVTGGVAPYAYSWVGPNGFVAITEDLSNLCAGTYTLTTTDANGCTATTTITLTQPEELSATAIAATTNGGTNISCSGVCDGSIDLTVAGGTAPYTISWTGPNGFVSAIEDISALCVGTYIASITDANGCAASVTVTLTAPEPIVSLGLVSEYAGGFNVGCNGGSNGSIDLTVSGGSGSYAYSWSGPNNFTANTDAISGLVAGTYTVIISDVNGCSDTLTFNLTEPQPLGSSATTLPSSCGQANGSADLTVTGGSGIYSYLWSGPNSFSSTSQDLNGVVGGEYIVEIIDTNGCVLVDTVNITVKPPVAATAVANNATCNSNCNGTIDLTVTEGETPFGFAWSGPNGFSASTEDVASLCAGDYTVIVTDGDGCTFTSTYSITAPTALAIDVTANNAANCSSSTGLVTIDVTGGTGGYSYSWTGPNGFASADQNLNGVAQGTYTVTVTDSLGCPATQTVTVGSVSNIVLVTEPTNVSCNGLNNGFACANVTGTTGALTYQWSNSDATQCTDSLGIGTYIVIVTDANGCTATDTVVITEPDPIVIAADIPVYPNGYNVSIIDGEDGSIDLTLNGGVAPYTYNWNVNNADSTLEDLSGLPADTFTVIVTDANGCTIVEEYILTEPPLIELPTGFSPQNGDGKNDYYVIHGIENLKDNKFTVFNRWGQVIYEKEAYANDWEGTNGNGTLMPDGTYFVLFTVQVPGQGQLTFKETVELRHTNKN
jgi:gliding motility-associated-like protein